MAFTWTEQRIQWYLDASGFGDFHERLAGVIAPHLAPQDHLCDLGCGLGQLDLQLAPLVSCVTCVDVDETVLEHLRRAADKAQISNLSTERGDAKDVNKLFDAVLMTFFGHPPQLMFDCMKLAKRVLIRVVHAHPNGTPGKPEKKRETTQSVAAALDAAGYTYQLMEGAFEFGQPLKSKEDARAFLRCNSPKIKGAALEAFLAEHLTQTGQNNFPFYLPGKKDLGIFIINTLQ